VHKLDLTTLVFGLRASANLRVLNSDGRGKNITAHCVLIDSFRAKQYARKNLVLCFFLMNQVNHKVTRVMRVRAQLYKFWYLGILKMIHLSYLHDSPAKAVLLSVQGRPLV